jgi:hypothetical protein
MTVNTNIGSVPKEFPEKFAPHPFFPIPLPKILAHTYVIWLARHSTLKLGPWDHVEYFIFSSWCCSSLSQPVLKICPTFRRNTAFGTQPTKFFSPATPVWRSWILALPIET